LDDSLGLYHPNVEKTEGNIKEGGDPASEYKVSNNDVSEEDGGGDG